MTTRDRSTSRAREDLADAITNRAVFQRDVYEDLVAELRAALGAVRSPADAALLHTMVELWRAVVAPESPPLHEAAYRLQRAVVAYAAAADRSPPAIAERLGISPSLAKERLRDAREDPAARRQLDAAFGQTAHDAALSGAIEQFTATLQVVVVQAVDAGTLLAVDRSSPPDE